MKVPLIPAGALCMAAALMFAWTADTMHARGRYATALLCLLFALKWAAMSALALFSDSQRQP